MISGYCDEKFSSARELFENNLISGFERGAAITVEIEGETVPDGVYIDADGLNEVDLGTGNAYNPEDALRLYFQTGSVVGRSYTQDGEFNHGRVPIQQLTSNIS